MSSEPKSPYYRECPDCGGHEIKTMWKTPNEVDYEYCVDCDKHEHMGFFLNGPGISPERMTPPWKIKIYEWYFGDCCAVCGGKDTKVYGYTQYGRGIPFRLCKQHATFDELPIHRRLYSVKPRDSEKFDKSANDKKRDLEIAEKKKNIKKMGVKQPIIGRTGKTQRKRERKV